MTLYLKYRPQKLEDLDLAQVRESLGKIANSDSLPHAFLFSGPKGTGKTSAARILAKVVNCTGKGAKPCNKCDQCVSITKGENLDVIELDAASHRGIDDMRTLRDVVKLSPAKAAKKVYIIDEAHMLTTEASNALLKTLEEPPEHVMFILATTNPEKLIDTVRSRVTNIVFKKATAEEVAKSLAKVIKGEGVKVEKGVVEVIAKAAGGSFRDAIKIFEQLTSNTKDLKTEEVEELLFQREAIDPKEFVTLLAQKNAKLLLQLIEKLVDGGGSAREFIEEVVGLLRSALLSEVGLSGEKIDNLDKERLVSLIKLLSKAASEVSFSVMEQIPLELAVIEWCGENGEEDGSEDGGGKSTKNEKNDGLMDRSEKVGDKVNGKTEEHQRKEKLVHKKRSVGNGDGKLSDEVWRELLTAIRPKNASTEALLRAAEPMGYDGERLTIGVFYSFHKERLDEHQHRSLLEETIEEITGVPVRVECMLSKQPRPKVVETVREEKVVLTEQHDSDIVNVAKELFGS